MTPPTVPEAGPQPVEPQWVTRESLGRALHATSPHAKLHPWELCPQQDYDLRDADDILTYLRLREAV